MDDEAGVFDRLNPTPVTNETSVTGLRVLENDRYRWLESAGGIVHSAIDKSRPDALLLPYTRWMLWPALFISRPQRALCLGLGAGSLPRFLSPWCATHCVDHDPDVIHWSRAHFDLPATVSTYAADARDAVRAEQTPGFDWVFCDVFDSMGVPDWLGNIAFQDACQAVLKPGGVVVVNVSAHDQDIVQHVFHAMTDAADGPVMDLAVPQTANLVIAAFSNSLPEIRRSTLDDRATTLEVALNLPFSQMAHALYHRYGTRGFLRFQSQARQQLLPR